MPDKKKVPQSIKILECVPFQLCPRCNGNGFIHTVMYNEGTNSYINICDVCNGAKVIPMAIIPEKKC